MIDIVKCTVKLMLIQIKLRGALQMFVCLKYASQTAQNITNFCKAYLVSNTQMSN